MSKVLIAFKSPRGETTLFYKIKKIKMSRKKATLNITVKSKAE